MIEWLVLGAAAVIVFTLYAALRLGARADQQIQTFYQGRDIEQ